MPRLITKNTRGLLSQIGLPNSRYVDQTVADWAAVAGVTATNNPTLLYAYSDFFTYLKANSLFTKLQAVYCLSAGTSTNTKYNIIDPQDTDAAFRIVWNGGLTFSSSGVISNGTTGYGDTKYIPNTSGSQNNAHLSFYSRTNLASNTACDMGVGTANSFYVYSRLAANTTGYGVNETFGASAYAGTTDSIGYWQITRGASNNRRLFRNGTKLQDAVTSSTGLQTNAVNILRLGGFAGEYSTRQLTFATIGTNFSDSEAALMATGVQTLMTALGL